MESKLTIFGQKNDLKKSHKTSDEMQLKIDKLEEENLALKEKYRILSNEQ